jgi:hypothetical protein
MAAASCGFRCLSRSAGLDPHADASEQRPRLKAGLRRSDPRDHLVKLGREGRIPVAALDESPPERVEAIEILAVFVAGIVR